MSPIPRASRRAGCWLARFSRPRSSSTPPNGARVGGEAGLLEPFKKAVEAAGAEPKESGGIARHHARPALVDPLALARGFSAYALSRENHPSGLVARRFCFAHRSTTPLDRFGRRRSLRVPGAQNAGESASLQSRRPGCRRGVARHAARTSPSSALIQTMESGPGLRGRQTSQCIPRTPSARSASSRT